MNNKSDTIIAWLTLFSGLSISVVSIYYSVAGLMSIFAAAAIPIMIMGIFLESSKLVATVWLKKYWTIAPAFIKFYLSFAVIILMFITSMGTYGYLSKAHMDQTATSGEVVSKVQIIDDKIKMHQDSILVAKHALSQLDAAVDQTMQRSTDERGASIAIKVRKSQTKERESLHTDIAEAQKIISKLNEEKAPFAQELRIVEAEVGPIKYIAAFLFGDNVDTNMLERAVRWVIILIVVVFDPLAVILLLTSQYSFQYINERKVLYKDEKIEEIVEEYIETQPVKHQHYKIKVNDTISTNDSTRLS